MKDTAAIKHEADALLNLVVHAMFVKRKCAILIQIEARIDTNKLIIILQEKSFDFSCRLKRY